MLSSLAYWLSLCSRCSNKWFFYYINPIFKWLKYNFFSYCLAIFTQFSWIKFSFVVSFHWRSNVYLWVGMSFSVCWQKTKNSINADATSKNVFSRIILFISMTLLRIILTLQKSWKFFPTSSANQNSLYINTRLNCLTSF